MPRLLGVDIPGKKKLPYALRYIYGLGLKRALILCESTGLDPDMRADDLAEDQLNKISEAIIEKNFVVEGDLRREVNSNIKRLEAIRCYRGTRHRRGLPVRGQRTRTNSRTRKGAKKTVGVIRAKK